MNMIKETFYIGKIQKEKLVKLSQKLEMSVGLLIRQAINEYLRKQEEKE